MARIVSTGTAVPPHRYTQEEIKPLARELFAGLGNVERLLSVFDRSGVRTRYLSQSIDYYRSGHPFSRRNRDYIESAVRLGEEAARRCLERTGVPPEEVDHLFFLTTTGLSTPSIDSMLARRLGLPVTVLRTPIFGVGCAGGAVGLSRAAQYCGEDPGRTALVVCVETCGQSFLVGDVTKVNFIGCSLFSDGGAAALVRGGEALTPAPLPKGEGSGRGEEFSLNVLIRDSGSLLIPDSEGVMGWDFIDEGFRLVLSPSVPQVLRGPVQEGLRSFLDRRGMTSDRIDHWILHPGGRRVIETWGEMLGGNGKETKLSASVLADFGNQSSASVLFVLDRLLQSGTAKRGDLGLLSAVGPGFAAEYLLLEF